MATAIAGKQGNGNGAGGKQATLIDTYPYIYEQVPIDRLIVDETYQRPLTPFWRKVASNFNPALLSPLVVSLRDEGVFVVVDGQTRLQALRSMGAEWAPCMVFNGDAEEEAELFALFQSERKGIRPYLRFRALLRAGDAVSLAIAKEVESHGYHVADAGSSSNAGAITAIRALEVLYLKGTLPEILRITALAWPATTENSKFGTHPHPISNEILKGLDYFIEKVYPSEPSYPNDERLVSALARVKPHELSERASYLRAGRGMGGGSPSYMAEAIAVEYRRRQQRK